jgi:adenylylsulfate reductase subunit A
MCVGQCGIWVGENVEPEKKNSELMPTEPYLLGSHSGCCGIWVSGPTDLGAPTDEAHADAGKIPAHLPKGWSWGYRSMTTVKGLFTAGDGVGASGHKFSSGSHAEGRMCAKAMVKYCIDNKDWKPELDTSVEQLVEDIYKPVPTSSTRTTPRRSTSTPTTSRPRCCSSVCRRSWTSMLPASPPTTRPMPTCWAWLKTS